MKAAVVLVIAFGFLAVATSAAASDANTDARGSGVGQLHVGTLRIGDDRVDAGRGTPAHPGKGTVDGAQRLVHGAAGPAVGAVASKAGHALRALGARALPQSSHVVRDAADLGSQEVAAVRRLERAAHSFTRSTVARLSLAPGPVRPMVAQLRRRLGDLPAPPLPVLPRPVQEVLALVGNSGAILRGEVSVLTSWLATGLPSPRQPLAGLLHVGNLRPVGGPSVAAGPLVGGKDLKSMRVPPVVVGGPSGPAAAGEAPLMDARAGVPSTGAASRVSPAAARRSFISVGGGVALGGDATQGQTGIASAAHGGGAPSGLILVLLTVLLVPAAWRRLRALTSPRLPLTLAYPLERPG